MSSSRYLSYSVPTVIEIISGKDEELGRAISEVKFCKKDEGSMSRHIDNIIEIFISHLNCSAIYILL